MSEKKYVRGSFKNIRVENEQGDKKSIIFKSLHAGAKADFSDPDNLLSLAYNARRNANDLFNLVMAEYRGKNPADISGFEMLVALINLASELYMKSIIYHFHLNEGTPCKGLHNLTDYFSKLPNNIQAELKTLNDDFDTQLKVINNYFTKFRYSYELNLITTTYFPFSLAERLKQICDNIPMRKPPEFVICENRLLLRQGKDVFFEISGNKWKYYASNSKKFKE